MNRQETQAALQRVGEALHQQFEDEVATHSLRLQQLDSALATAAMAAECLFDEEEREIELAQRMVARTRVHGDNEVISPTGRTREQAAVIAARGK